MPTPKKKTTNATKFSNSPKPNAPGGHHKQAVRTCKLAVPAAMMPADPTRSLFKGMELHFSEAYMLGWPSMHGVFPVILPSIKQVSDSMLEDILSECSGLLLQGGEDIDPSLYGEKPLQASWYYAKQRDEFEIRCFLAARKLGMPIMGICRGHQLINVAMGGSLMQDIATQYDDHAPQSPAFRAAEGPFNHRNWDVYEENLHPMQFHPNTYLASLYEEHLKLPSPISEKVFTINSIHHQSIKTLAPELQICATSLDDGIIEAIEAVREDEYIVGMQWHPEFNPSTRKKLVEKIADQSDPELESAHAGFLDETPIFTDFIDKVKGFRP